MLYPADTGLLHLFLLRSHSYLAYLCHDFCKLQAAAKCIMYNTQPGGPSCDAYRIGGQAATFLYWYVRGARNLPSGLLHRKCKKRFPVTCGSDGMVQHCKRLFRYGDTFPRVRGHGFRRRNRTSRAEVINPGLPILMDIDGILKAIPRALILTLFS